MEELPVHRKSTYRNTVGLFTNYPHYWRKRIGKSTILDALCFVLFNKPFRNISKSQLVNSVNGGGTVVEVEFNVNNKDVKVIRGIKPNKFEVWIGDTMINQDANARDYQKHLEQIDFRFELSFIHSSCYSRFFYLCTFHAVVYKARREVVEDILDIKIFSLMNFLLKNKNKSLLEDIRDVEYKYDLTKEKVNLQEKFIEEVVNNKSVIIAENRQKVYDNNFTIDAKKDDVKALQVENDELVVDAEEHTKVEQKLKKLTQTEAALQNRKSEHERQIQFFQTNDECPSCEQPITESTKQTQIESRTTKIGDIENGITDLQRMESEEQDRLQLILNSLDNIRKNDVEKAKILSSIAELEKFNVKLEKDIQKYEER